ncbi:MAG: AsmA-like C-terminal region-containing protein, partial [Cyclobacteriaceae bacterium]
IGEFGIKGNPPFQNDTLAHVGEFQVDLNLWSVLFDDYPTLTGIHLIDGNIYVKVLEDGQANYDIMFEVEEEPITEEPSEFQIGVDMIEVENLSFIYDDRDLGFLMALSELDLNGGGNFTMDVYDLLAKGNGNIVRVVYDEVEYLSNKRMEIDSKINVDLENMKFGFEDASIKLNEFGFGLEGYLAMPTEDMEFDARFYGEDNSFGSILSLVPGLYTDSFQSLDTSGEMDFSGFVKGVYNENKMPSFELALAVNDGMFKYPDLPRPVQNVNINLMVKNESDVMEHTSIDISDFSLQFGEQPLSGNFYLKNLIDFEMEGALLGDLDLFELTSIFPIEDMELRGNLVIDAKAKGKYDSIAQTMPAINARLALSNGYVKSAAYPGAIEDLNMEARAINNTGNMSDMLIDLSSFGFNLDGEDIRGNLKVQDLEALNYDFSVHGGVDLGKLSEIFSMEEIILEGQVLADIDAKGSYSDVENNRFDQLNTKGEITLKDFFYADNDYPQGIRVHEALSEFSPTSIKLVKMDARLGESTVQANGNLSNYMAYLFDDNNGILKGDLDLYSPKFNVNEWMGQEDDPEDSTSLEIIELPRDITFTMSVKADEILYDNLSLKNAQGVLVLNDGVLNFNGFRTNTLGGGLAFNGSYNSQDITQPSFDMNLDISELGIQEAFQSFVTVKTFAPIAQHVTGKFSTNFSFSGLLGQDMIPILSSLDGKGLIKLAEAAVKDSPLLKGITSITNLNETSTITLKPFNLSAEIVDGMLNIAPFDVQLWDYKAQIQGSTGFDGTINYLVAMDVPASKFGSKINNLVSGLVGADLSTTNIPLAFNIMGSYSRPNVSLASAENLDSYITNALRNRLTNENSVVKESITADFKAKEDSLKQEIKQRAEVARDSAKQEVEKLKDQTQEKAVNEVKNLLKGFTTRPKPKEAPENVPE